VTRHIRPEHVNGGDVDVYLCGPPAMVDAVRKHFTDQGVTPMSFYYEKFSDTGVVSQIGESHLTASDSDQAFDARMAIELNAAQLTVGRLTPEQIAEYRQLAEATVRSVEAGHLTDVSAFRQANAAFHIFPVQSTGDSALIEAYRRLPVQEYIAQALSSATDLTTIVQDHLDLVNAFERGDIGGARAVIVAHNDHTKSAMRTVIEQAGNRIRR
jgi:benzoate/toluate 1,2-dioxygenase reductase component